MFPGAGWNGRCWSVERYSFVVQWLKTNKNIDTVIAGGKGEEELGMRLVELIGFQVTNFIGKTSLGVLSVIIKNSEFYFGNDTGIAHLAMRI